MKLLIVFSILMISSPSYGTDVVASRIELSESNKEELGIEVSTQGGWCNEDTPLVEIRPSWEFRDALLTEATVSVSHKRELLFRGFLHARQDTTNLKKGFLAFCLNKHNFAEASLILFYKKGQHTTDQIFINNLDELIQ